MTSPLPSGTPSPSATIPLVEQPAPLTPEKEAELRAVARTLRKHILTMLARAGSGHPGGSLSAVEIVTTLYFGGILRHDPANPHWPERDRFVLSKGHCAPLLYAVLAERGYFTLKELENLRRLDSLLQGHADLRTPGVEVPSGPVGQGLSVGIGMALAGRLDRRDYRVYVLLGDGECQEGQVWEAAMAAAHYRLDHLTAFVDRNGIQNDDFVEKQMPLDPLPDKWEAFGWNVIEVDGHDVSSLTNALLTARETKGRPTVIIAHTVKGKGYSKMQNNPAFHGKAPNAEELAEALAELA